MKCPFCFNDESKVVDSRSTDDNTTIRRRRECTKCNKRYTTYEKIEDIPILVVKRDLTRENFNKEKIVNGLIIACQKRPVSRKQIEEIAEEISRNTEEEEEKGEVQSEIHKNVEVQQLKSEQNDICTFCRENTNSILGDKDNKILLYFDSSTREIGITNKDTGEINFIKFKYCPECGRKIY